MGELHISFQRLMDSDKCRWALGLIYIIAVATIWIAASYIVQSVVDAGVSPFLITYICNSLFMIYIPIVEIARYFEDSVENVWYSFSNKKGSQVPQSGDLENVNLLHETNHIPNVLLSSDGDHTVSQTESIYQDSASDKVTAIPQPGPMVITEDYGNQVDAKGRWTRSRVAKVSLLICPFWFFAQLTFNFSLKYTTVTSNTILSSTSSLFTFLVSVAVLGEAFTWVKLVSVLFCMGGTIIVSLSDSDTKSNAIATSPFLGDILALVSAGLYAVYITLIRKKLPDEKKGEGLLDNVLSDYLWAKAIHLTTTTVATAGLTIQVPIAAIVDSLTGRAPRLMEYMGAAAVMVGFAGINIPSDAFNCSQVQQELQESDIVVSVEHQKASVSDS